MTDRDRKVLYLLRRHRVLTTHHITDAFFDSPITARHRMRVMYSLRLVDRFEVVANVGSAPHHWVLDHAGWLVTSNNPEAKINWSSKQALSIQHSQRLAHLLGVNAFFCSLLKAGRGGGGELVRWDSENQLSKEFRDMVKPDGYGLWREGNLQVGFFLEYDRGTETLARLAAKFDGYRELQRIYEKRLLVLFCFPGARREANARRVLANSGMDIATAVVPADTSPHEALWLAVDGPQRRVRLTEVGASRDETYL